MMKNRRIKRDVTAKENAVKENFYELGILEAKRESDSKENTLTKMEIGIIHKLAEDAFTNLKYEYLIKGDMKSFNSYMDIYRVLLREECGVAATLIDLLLGDNGYDETCEYMRTVCHENPAAVEKLSKEIDALYKEHFLEEIFGDEDDEDEDEEDYEYEMEPPISEESDGPVEFSVKFGDLCIEGTVTDNMKEGDFDE